MKVVIIIPTYNERENIGLLIEALEEEFKAISNHEMGILVVDDNSPDGTQEVVREKMSRWDNIELLTGEKRGLGVATVRGLRYAMTRMGAEIVAAMEGDLSHDPRDIPRLLAEIDSGAGFVIGSRYVRGGGIPKDWGFHRKLLSFGANLVARILGVWEVRDQTPALRAIRVRGVLDQMDLNNLPSGYTIQVALVCRAYDVDAKFAEVPIRYTTRGEGKSKMPSSTFFETLGFLIKYRLAKVVSRL